MNICSLCGETAVAELLNAGPQPICNRFLRNPEHEEYANPLSLGQCAACGLLQLIAPVPCPELLPPYEWITYKEPEGHLDMLADIIASLPGVRKDSAICGVSFKDDTLLRRMNQRGIASTWRLDLERDLGIAEPSAGVETIQNRIAREMSDAVVRTRGRADVVIARHILEHAYDMPRLMEGLKRLINPDGYLVLEVPDCARAFDTLDYTTLWEEHFSYFTGATFRNGVSLLGCNPVRMERYPYPFEDSLVGVCRFGDTGSSPFRSEAALRNEMARGTNFGRAFDARKNAMKTYLQGFRANEGRIALFGAGHLACVFANLFDLASTVDFVVDDNPNKRGLFMPGSRLPVRQSSALTESNIRLCLLCLSPESEEKVIQNNHEYIRRGGRFASVIPSSAHALRPE